MSSSDKPKAAGSIPTAQEIQAAFEEALIGAGGISYGIKMEIFIDLPIIGKITLPISATGTIPLPFPFMNMNADIGADGEEEEKKK